MLAPHDAVLTGQVMKEQREDWIACTDPRLARRLEQRIQFQPRGLQAAFEFAELRRHQAGLIAQQRRQPLEICLATVLQLDLQFREFEHAGGFIRPLVSFDTGLVDIELDADRPRVRSLDFEDGAPTRYVEKLDHRFVADQALELFPDRAMGQRQRRVFLVSLSVLADLRPHQYGVVRAVERLQRRYFVTVPAAHAARPAVGQDRPVLRVEIAIGVLRRTLRRNRKPVCLERAQRPIDLFGAPNDEFRLYLFHSRIAVRIRSCSHSTRLQYGLKPSMLTGLRAAV